MFVYLLCCEISTRFSVALRSFPLILNKLMTFSNSSLSSRRLATYSGFSAAVPGGAQFLRTLENGLGKIPIRDCTFSPGRPLDRNPVGGKFKVCGRLLWGKTVFPETPAGADNFWLYRAASQYHRAISSRFIFLMKICIFVSKMMNRQKYLDKF